MECLLGATWAEHPVTKREIRAGLLGPSYSFNVELLAIYPPRLGRLYGCLNCSLRPSRRQLPLDQEF